MKHLAFVLALAVAGCGYTPMALYTKECANLGIDRSDSRFVDCVAWREQVLFQRGQAFDQSLATTAGIINMLSPPVQRYQVQWQ